MKKIVVLLVVGVALSLFLIVPMRAQNTISVTEGDLAFLQEEATAVAIFDFSKARVGDGSVEDYLKTLGDDYVEDWPNVQAEARTKMINEFNRKSKALKFRESETMVKARYEFVFNVLYYKPADQMKKNVPLVSKAGGDIISGTLEVKDRETDAIVCRVLIDEVRGKSFPSDGTRLGYVFTEVMSRLLKQTSKK